MAGSGTLSITNGGYVAGGRAYIATMGGVPQIVNSSGAVTVDGANSTWRLYGDPATVYIGGTNALTPAGGTALLNITNGGTVIVNNPLAGYTSINVGISGTLAGNGTMIAMGTQNFPAWLVQVRGTLAPNGTFTIDGHLALDNDRAGTVCNVTPSGADMVEVSKQAFLGGRLSVTMNGTFLPYGTRRFTLLHANEGIGDIAPGVPSRFGSVSIKYPVDQGFEPQISYDSKDVYLDLVFPNGGL
jgi:T5SS/PEP-CTERM-associated repeat protein